MICCCWLFGFLKGLSICSRFSAFVTQQTSVQGCSHLLSETLYSSFVNLLTTDYSSSGLDSMGGNQQTHTDTGKTVQTVRSFLLWDDCNSSAALGSNTVLDSGSGSSVKKAKRIKQSITSLLEIFGRIRTRWFHSGPFVVSCSPAIREPFVLAHPSHPSRGPSPSRQSPSHPQGWFQPSLPSRAAHFWLNPSSSICACVWPRGPIIPCVKSWFHSQLSSSTCAVTSASPALRRWFPPEDCERPSLSLCLAFVLAEL